MRKHCRAFPLKIKVRFSFFAVLGFLICTDSEGVSFMCAAACVLHELGHIAVMYAEKKPPFRITLYGGGIHIEGGSTDFFSAAAGIAVNITLFLLFGLIPWENRELRLFGVVNLLIGTFNLLPLGELDGKLMLDRALIRGFQPAAAVHISELCEKLVLALTLPAVVILVFSGYLNYSAVIFLIYILAVEFLEKI